MCSTVASFLSYTGWPCGPVSELEAFWLVPDATLSDTADWLDEHSAGGLVSVWGDHRPDGTNSDGMTLVGAEIVDRLHVNAEILGELTCCAHWLEAQAGQAFKVHVQKVG